MLAPPRIRSPATRRLATALVRLDRLTKIIPVVHMYQPRNGTHCNCFLATNRTSTGIARKSVGMSIVDWWLET